MQVDNVQQLTDGQLSELLALVETATEADSVAPLSEQVLLAARDRHAADSSPSHFLAYSGTHLAGYAHLERGQSGDDATGEVVVDPGHRKRGVGTALVHALEHSLTAVAPDHGNSHLEAGTSQPGTGTDSTSQSEAGTSQSEAGTSQPDAGSSRLDAVAVTLRVWAHGHLDGARALALREGYSIVRELWQMHRSLASDATSLPDTTSPAANPLPDTTSTVADPAPDATAPPNTTSTVADPAPDATAPPNTTSPPADPPPDATAPPNTTSPPADPAPDTTAPPENGLAEVRLPEGFSSRHFVVGQDEDEWLRVNAAAFVDHPEQGRMTRLDLDQRIAESWFDAEGFILIEDNRGPAPVLAASHWTKVAPAADPEASPTDGEVYVVGVDPAYQGMGLGRSVTVLGLAHLRERGLSEATLYVDGDNRAAIATYARLGFARFAVDIMYSRTVHPPV